jgi:hypothetical protein
LQRRVSFPSPAWFLSIEASRPLPPLFARSFSIPTFEGPIVLLLLLLLLGSLGVLVVVVVV